MRPGLAGGPAVTANIRGSGMPRIELAYVNIALNFFGFIVIAIIFSACFGEWLKQRSGTKSFIILLGFVMLALMADTVSWICEGQTELAMATIISNTIASCAGQIATICFMRYLRINLYTNSRGAAFTLNVFSVFCVLSVLFAIGNAFFGYSFVVSSNGHYVHSENTVMVLLHFAFSITSFAAIVLLAIFAKTSSRSNRVAFIIYALLPLAGIIADYSIHGISLTYVSIVISMLVLYTNIYLEKQRLIEEQKSALMLSQINPHFTYNTLSAIAAMCDVSPKQAKNLTIDFARYLRSNIDALSSEQRIPFQKELEHVECYLKIEKARFREKLNIIYSVDCKDFFIPPLSVQPIVENAVKHGITKRSEGGTLKISTYIKEEKYIVEIIDDGVGFDVEAFESNKQGHIGLDNVRSRIRRICKGKLSIKSTFGVGTRVTIEIPCEQGRRE